MEYNTITERNSVREYATMNLKIPNEVINAACPSRITFGTQVISDNLEVKGLATLQEENNRNVNENRYYNVIMCIIRCIFLT